MVYEARTNLLLFVGTLIVVAGLFQILLLQLLHRRRNMIQNTHLPDVPDALTSRALSLKPCNVNERLWLDDDDAMASMQLRVGAATTRFGQAM